MTAWHGNSCEAVGAEVGGSRHHSRRRGGCRTRDRRAEQVFRWWCGGLRSTGLPALRPSPSRRRRIRRLLPNRRAAGLRWTGRSLLRPVRWRCRRPKSRRRRGCALCAGRRTGSRRATTGLERVAYNQVIPRTGDTFIGAPGAVLDGGHKNRYAFGGKAARRHDQVPDGAELRLDAARTTTKAWSTTTRRRAGR